MFICVRRQICRFAVLAILLAGGRAAAAQTPTLGIFTGQQDVGAVLHPGSVEYDSAKHTYTVSGSGENMWFGNDEFHFVWKKATGDTALTATISLLGTTGDNHRKAVVMFRKTLDANSPSVHLAVHGDGLTSLQFRDAVGANMHEVQANQKAPATVRIERRGDYIYAFVAGKDGKLRPSGAATRLPFDGEFYAGIGVCAHDKDALQKAVFSNVTLEQLPAAGKRVAVSTLETIPIASTDRHVEYVAAGQFESPTWSRDCSFFLFSQGGVLRKLAVGASEAETVATGAQVHCNDDHGISPDGKWLATSDCSSEDKKARIYVLPVAGGTPRLVTPNGPSYWHGWSPDGKTLAYTALRGDNYDVYSIPAAGGDETRLTTDTALDDGAEYSPDGAFIYFTSDRSGHMQIWRMRADGSQQEQVLAEETGDWFPHISPDGQWMVYLAYEKGVAGHPREKDVELRLMSMKDKSVRVIAKLVGGLGTIDVPSWSPDSKKLAFVSYEELPVDSPGVQ
jgi:hypothetical protein